MARVPKDPMEGLATCARAPKSTATATWTGCARSRKIQRPPHRPVGAPGETPTGFSLMLTDEDGNVGSAEAAAPPASHRCRQGRSQPARATGPLWRHGVCGARHCAAVVAALVLPASVLNALRRDAVADLEANRARNFARLPRATPVEPLCPYPKTRSRSSAACSTTRPTTSTCATA